jgi:hypothetical protein
MKLFLSWGYVLAAIVSAVAAFKTGQYGLLWGVPISFAALPIVSLAPIARNILDTASLDAAIPAPVRAIARLLTRFSFAVILLWPAIYCVLLFTDHSVGAWLVGTYVVASNTLRWYRAKYIAPRQFRSMTNVVPGETAVIVKAMFAFLNNFFHH